MAPGAAAAILLVPDGEKDRHNAQAERAPGRAGGSRERSQATQEKQMSQTQDPTFYRTPADAIAAPPEKLAYVAAFEPAGRGKDAITVLDTDPASPDYGRVVGC